MNTESNPARLTFTSAADFKAACKSANRNAPGGWGQLASALIKAGHGDALNDVLPLLSKDRGQKLVRPNNARELERMTRNLTNLKCFNEGIPTPGEIPDIGGDEMGSFHPPEPTKPAFDGLTRGEYFARKTARQNATKVKNK